MSWDGLAGAGVSLADSAHDTGRFGLRVARLTVGNRTPAVQAVADEVRSALAATSAEVVVARWPAALTGLADLVSRLAPRVISADTLVYWDVEAGELAARPAPGDDLESQAGGAAAHDFRAVLADSFRDYPSHYSANGLFPAEQVLAGYLEWAERTLEERPEDVVSLLREGRPIGFATCLPGGGGEFLEIELAGLLTAEQGGGRYATLLRGVGAMAQERGASRVVISTQASNVRVQRAWARAGFAPFAAFTTVHLMLQERKS